MFKNDDAFLGKLVGNTGQPDKLTVALRTSFSARRGEFVRIPHQERESDPQLDVLGRIVSLSRSNILFSQALGEGISEVELLPQSRVSGETVYGTVELVGYKDPYSAEIRIPRRPLTPGTKVYGVDFSFLSTFYDFAEDTSIHVGNLVGYEKGEHVVPVFLDANTLVTEHLAVLAMTGSGKSYTVGRVIERLVAQLNASVIVFDPHGEYGKAFRGGKLNFNERLDQIEDRRDCEKLAEIQRRLIILQERGGGIRVYTPQLRSFDEKYATKNTHLALQLDHFDVDEFSGVLPGLTEPQQRVLDVALRYWKENFDEPRDINELFGVLDDLERLKTWVAQSGSPGEASALKGGSANIAAIRLRRMINEAQSFFSRAVAKPFDVHEMVGDDGSQMGALCIVDLQGLSTTARQVIVALISSELMKAAADKQRPIRPVFVVYEEGHNFAPNGEASISKNIIKRIAAEGRKFGVGFAIVSQRPSKLDADVTSQCNTIIAMRIKNPDDQRFIEKTSDYFSAADLAELPTLSTGEALICGRAIIAPLVVKVGTKALIHGGESPRVCERWGQFNFDERK